MSARLHVNGLLACVYNAMRCLHVFKTENLKRFSLCVSVCMENLCSSSSSSSSSMLPLLLLMFFLLIRIFFFHHHPRLRINVLRFSLFCVYIRCVFFYILFIPIPYSICTSFPSLDCFLCSSLSLHSLNFQIRFSHLRIFVCYVLLDEHQHAVLYCCLLLLL